MVIAVKMICNNDSSWLCIALVMASVLVCTDGEHLNVFQQNIPGFGRDGKSMTAVQIENSYIPR